MGSGMTLQVIGVERIWVGLEYLQSRAVLTKSCLLFLDFRSWILVNTLLSMEWTNAYGHQRELSPIVIACL